MALPVKAAPRGLFALVPVRIVVLFEDAATLPGVDAFAGSDLDSGGNPAIALVLATLKFRRALAALTLDQITTLSDQAVAGDSGFEPVALERYYLVDMPVSVVPDDIAGMLDQRDDVVFAYVSESGPAPIVASPNEVVRNDPDWPTQGHLQPAPVGVDAEYAWRFLDGDDDEGVTFCDVERGWKLQHEDLKLPDRLIWRGDNFDPSKPHGTRAVGTVCALHDNDTCGVGIAPNVARLRLCATMKKDPADAWSENVPDAIAYAAFHLQRGDVLLIESQTGELRPREVEPLDFDVIRAATAKGIVVVEAAGNDGHDLDLVKDVEGGAILDRNAPGGGFRDSFAILVGSAFNEVPHRQTNSSNRGSRIDCYAWGEDVKTTDVRSTSSPLVDMTSPPQFTGTSAASAVIAGVAAVVQGVLSAHGRPRLDSAGMRELLSNPDLGTPIHPTVAAPSTAPVGVMPDLRKIIDVGFGVTASVYLRPFPTAVDPVLPWPDVHRCPDLPVLDAVPPDPGGRLGEGSGSENEIITPAYSRGSTYHVIPRLTNSRATPSGPVEVALFEGPPAAFLPPSMWTQLSDVNSRVASVPGNRVLTVSSPISWTARNSGPRTLVGVLGSAGRPVSAPRRFGSMRRYSKALQTTRTLGLCGYARVPFAATRTGIASFASAMQLPFFVCGADHGRASMALEVDSWLPLGAQLLLEAPRPWLRRVFDSAAIGNGRTAATGLAAIPPGHWSSPSWRIKPGAQHEAVLYVSGPRPLGRFRGRVTVRQRWRGRPVGGMTWQLVPTAPGGPGGLGFPGTS